MPLTQEGPGWAGCLGGTELHGLPLFQGCAKSLGPLGQPLLHSGPFTGFQANLWVPQASSLLVPAPPLGSGPREAACFLESSRELLASASPRVPSAWWSPRHPSPVGPSCWEACSDVRALLPCWAALDRVLGK